MRMLPSLRRSLSARLLLLTILFVMLSEVLIFAPSIGRFRLVYLEERLAAGRLAILALEATPDHMVSEALEAELLAHAHAHLIAIRRPDALRAALARHARGLATNASRTSSRVRRKR